MTDPAPSSPSPAHRSTDPPPPSPAWWWGIGAALFVSGAISLVYQVLWMRRLGLLFGNTSQAAATTLTAFFLGLALGGHFGGRLAARLKRPLRAYAAAEIGIALGAAFYFALMGAYRSIVPVISGPLGDHPALFLGAKFLLGVVVLLPASLMIGATLPLVGEYMLRSRDQLGRGGTVLYAINTLGAAFGTWLAGFYLPLALGFDATYRLAMAGNLTLGAILLIAGRLVPESVPLPPSVAPDPGAAPGPSWNRVRWLAALSGAVTLALEVLWTHMFSQVLHNSVYTFAIILISFLLALTAGSWLAHRRIRAGADGVRTVVVLLGAGSLLVALSPWTFYALTGGLRYIADRQGWGAYLALVFALAAVVIVPPTTLLGTVFPLLLKLSEKHARSAGRTVGDLVAINTLAAIAGSLLAGFALLSWVGLWSAIRFVAGLSLLGVPLIAARHLPGASVARWSAAAAGLLVLSVTGWGQPPVVRLDADDEEVLVQQWEGPAGVVAVVRNTSGLVIKVNNHYTLGGSGSAEDERRQGLLPLLLHPHPAEVFYLGMGTGITASAAITQGVRRATVCELVPDVITAARAHFAPFTGALFTDPRTRIIAEDGRMFLQVTDERYDVIVSDLFVPWEARAGNLYSLEHFRTVRDRLRPGGVFAQWLPCYQMSRQEVAIVARTLLEVFPQVTVWRGDWKVNSPTLALVAVLDPAPLDPEAVKRRIATTSDPALLGSLGPGVTRLLWGYCGNLSAARQLVSDAPINSDDHPLIEYLAPITHRRANTRRASWLTGETLIAWLEELQAAVPPERDPYLARVPEALRGHARAGLLSHRGAMLRRAGRTNEVAANDEAMREVLIRLIRAGSGSPAPLSGE